MSKQLFIKGVLFVLLLFLIVCLLYKAYRRLMLQLDKATRLVYTRDLKLLTEYIASVKTLGELKNAEKKLDALRREIDKHYGPDFLKAEFDKAYLLVVDKMIEFYGEEIDQYEEDSYLNENEEE
ncbi:MAG: hypothetical protein QM610_04315 [Chitinophagaceae bacterium]